VLLPASSSVPVPVLVTPSVALPVMFARIERSLGALTESPTLNVRVAPPSASDALPIG
jgi:hypothetical protein